MVSYTINKHAKGEYLVKLTFYSHDLQGREVWSAINTYPCYKDLREILNLSYTIPEIYEDQTYVYYTFKTNVENMELVFDILADCKYYNLKQMEGILSDIKGE